MATEKVVEKWPIYEISSGEGKLVVKYAFKSDPFSATDKHYQLIGGTKFWRAFDVFLERMVFINLERATIILPTTEYYEKTV